MESEKKYQIVYADPPWPERGGGKIKRGADRHYPLMSITEIMNLPVKKITTPNAHLYLWTTNTYLPQAFDVIKAWGFDYKTAITWFKDKIGLGQYFRGKTEHCLFAVRGMIPYKCENGKRCQGETAFYAQRFKHSKKPYQMRKMIELVSDRDGFNKIELFAREATPGWDIWGNEIESVSIAPLSRATGLVTTTEK